jgi:hypothetical protein
VAWGFSVLGTWVFAIVLALYAYYEHGNLWIRTFGSLLQCRFGV